jgi:tetratricopeptide (TPR) repeat protein
MKNPFKSPLLLTMLILFCFSNRLFAQVDNQPLSLVKQGELLHSQGKYDESIAKFTEALKADPQDAAANYGIAFTLYSAKRPLEGIPYLEKVVTSSHPGLVMGAYSLMGSIYDENHQPLKAVEAFNQAIKLAPDYPGIYYNIGLAYSRNQQYAEAEIAAIEAIKRDPKSANNQRLYALATFHQNKRMNALLGFCSFILIEPTGPRTAEAFNNIQSILKGGVLKDSNGNIPKTDQETNLLNADITKVVAAGQAKKLTGTDLLEYEFKGIFILAGQ